jgi:hypothetical protein
LIGSNTPTAATTTNANTAISHQRVRAIIVTGLSPRRAREARKKVPEVGRPTVSGEPLRFVAL